MLETLAMFNFGSNGNTAIEDLPLPDSMNASVNGNGKALRKQAQANVPTAQPIQPQQQQPKKELNVLELIANIAASEKAGVMAYNYFSQIVTGRCRLCFPEHFDKARKESLNHANQCAKYLMMFGGREWVCARPDMNELEKLPMQIEDILQWIIFHEYRLSVSYTQLLNLVKGQNAILEDWAFNMVRIENDDLLEWRLLAEQV